MLRRSLLLLLLLVPLVAFGAAPAAATEGSFTAGAYPATITAAQNTTVFGIGSLWKVTCSETTFSGTLSFKTNGLELNETYGGCTANGGLPVTTRSNGCIYAWKLEELEAPGTAKGRTSSTCAGGKMVEFETFEGALQHAFGVSVCTFGLPVQVRYSALTHNGESSGIEDVLMTINLSGFEFKVLKGTKASCGAPVGETVVGTYTGSQTLGASKEGKAVSLMVG
jgi:hypothetical protein